MPGSASDDKRSDMSVEPQPGNANLNGNENEFRIAKTALGGGLDEKKEAFGQQQQMEMQQLQQGQNQAFRNSANQGRSSSGCVPSELPLPPALPVRYANLHYGDTDDQTPGGESNGRHTPAVPGPGASADAHAVSPTSASPSASQLNANEREAMLN